MFRRELCSSAFISPCMDYSTIGAFAEPGVAHPGLGPVWVIGTRSFRCRLRSVVPPGLFPGSSEEPACELGFGLCSARLQAGILHTPKYPPEGGRYTIAVNRCSHAH